MQISLCKHCRLYSWLLTPVDLSHFEMQRAMGAIDKGAYTAVRIGIAAEPSLQR